MKYYTVKEIANLLETNPETVRRWIRSNDLIAEHSSRKNGNQVSEENLMKFLRARPRYTTAIGKITVGRILNKYGDTPVSALQVTSTPVEELLAEHIDSCYEAIRQKEAEIIALRAEIGKFQAVLKSIRNHDD